MSYEVHFKGMPAETMEKYNKKNKCNFHFNNEYKLALEVFVMRKEEKPIDVKDGVFQIKLLLAGIEADINQNEEQFAYDRWKEDKDNILWYCGWQYSHESSNNDRDSIYKDVVEKLTLLKYCADAGDYFDEHSHFYDKLHEVKETIDWFEDVIMELKIFEIMNELKEYRIPDNYDNTDEHNENNE